MKEILVIGGSYFLGRVCVEELLKKKEFTVTVVNRGKLPLNKDRVREVVCDRHDTEGMKNLLAGTKWDAVIDFCAYAPGDIGEVFQTGIPKETTQYIYISTASVYAKTNMFPVKEEAPKLEGPQPELGPFADYAFNKLLLEEELTSQCGELGTAWTIIRPAFIYGKYNYAPRENYFFDLIVRNEKVIIPERSLTLFSFVSVWDTARIIIGCAGNEAVFGKPFNVSAEELVSYPMLMDVLREVTSISFNVETKSIETIIHENIPLPFPLDEHLVYDGTLIADTLQFRYTSFLEGMRETYRLYRIGRGLS